MDEKRQQVVQLTVHVVAYLELWTKFRILGEYPQIGQKGGEGGIPGEILTAN